MISPFNFDLIATNIAIQFNEKCSCTSNLYITWDKDMDEHKLLNIKCPKCTTIFPFTLMRMIEKVNTLKRGLWRE